MSGNSRIESRFHNAPSFIDLRSVFVPRPLVLVELADFLRQSNPTEAANVYQQIKKEFPDSPVVERADRGLGMIAPKS